MNEPLIMAAALGAGICPECHGPVAFCTGPVRWECEKCLAMYTRNPKTGDIDRTVLHPAFWKRLTDGL